MKQDFAYECKQDFLAKMHELLSEGVPAQSISVIVPYHVHELDNILDTTPSKLKYFTFGGAFTGLAGGFALTIFTVLSWQIITGGKPLISIPAFIIIAFALTILLGALGSFAGFLLLAGLPDINKIISPKEYGNQFVIMVDTPGTEDNHDPGDDT